MKKGFLGVWVLLAAGLWLGACTQLKEGECKRDSHCDSMAKQKGAVWVCYKEPADAEIGTCMPAKDAKQALERYKKKLSGKCEDKDGDGVKAGDACDPPVDCNDNDKAVHPRATEICDAKDNDCDDVINEGQKRCVGTVLGGKRDPVCQFMTTMTSGVEVAPNGEIWVSDQHQIYKIDSSDKAHRIAGSNKPGHEDKKGNFARFDQPVGMAIAADGTVYVAECENNCVRRLSADGQVSVWAGLCSNQADNTGLDKVGKWDEARFWCPTDVVFDEDGSLLVVDRLNSKIKRITKDRQVEHVAGLGGKETEEGVEFGHSSGPAKKAEFNEPVSIARGSDGSYYIADMNNNCVRQLKGGRVSDFAGVCGKVDIDAASFADGPAGSAKFKRPNGIAVGRDGVIWVADTGNHCIRRIEGGKVSTAAGKCKQQGYYDGAIDEALFNQPITIDVDKGGALWVVDLGNYRVRRVYP
ncbi:MAG: SMP-30/gluconolactonase/LRE family protein [Deltaproteobacteria bacterium]|nr:SMP-30/gluconolactonase/LRE family protein [Deltaproteobacteria bacterium]